MVVQLSAPSKTFLVGEYGVLEGGPALVVATEPRFAIQIKTDGEGVCSGVHPSSPAGTWARQWRDIFGNVDLEFFDPHQGRGGFGASTAQFLLLWAWTQMAHRPFVQLSEGLDVESLHQQYLSLFQDQPTPPSGADIVAQCLGGVSVITTSPLSYHQREWPWVEMDFLVVPTGKKLATHEHLPQLERGGLGELASASREVCAAYLREDRSAFVLGIQNFAKLLETQKRVASHTKEILASLAKEPGVLAAKGCGALGADAFVVFVEKSESLSIRNKLNSRGFPVLASSLSVSNGLGLQMEMQKSYRTVPAKQNSSGDRTS